MRLEGVDLNLLVVLDALLREPTVTAASVRLGLSQSATSHALARLRVLLDDPVLERTSKGMVPTARARTLALPLRAILDQIAAALEPQEPFDPRTSRARFTLSLDEGTQLGTLPELVARLATMAPGVSVRSFATSSRVLLEGLASGEIDLGITVSTKLPREFHVEPVITFRYVSIARADHPAIGKRLTLRKFVDAEHVVIATADSIDHDLDRRLAARGFSRRVVVSTSSPLSVPAIVARTRYVATLPNLLFPLVSGRLAITRHVPPIALDPVSISMVWHARSHGDPAHRFVRELLRSVFAADETSRSRIP